MRRKLAGVAVALAILAPAPVLAVPYEFSFTGPLGTVTGEIDGLSPGYSGPASDVKIDSAPSLFLIPSLLPADFFPNPTNNNFVVDGAGNVTSYSLSANFQVYITLNLSSSCLLCNEIDDGANFDTASSFPAFSGLTSGATPLPAALPLLATGLGLMGWLGGRRRKRKAA